MEQMPKGNFRPLIRKYNGATGGRALASTFRTPCNMASLTLEGSIVALTRLFIDRYKDRFEVGVYLKGSTDFVLNVLKGSSFQVLA